MNIDQDRYTARPPAFGAWLLSQTQRGGFIGHLATAAADDRRFPKAGDVDAARRWLQSTGASGDDWEALEDAETAWQATLDA